MPKFSIIIPAYNAHKTIRRAINSVIKAKPKGGYEIIIVDDCSDKTYDCLMKEYKSLPAETIILGETKKNSGAGVARNVGLELAKGKWVTFLDADDTVNPCLFKMPENEDDYDMIGGTIKVTLLNKSEVLYDASGAGGDQIHHGKLFRTEFLKNNHIRWHQQLRISEDVYFVMLCRKYLSLDRILYRDNDIVYNLISSNDSTTKRICKDDDYKWLTYSVDNSLYSKLCMIMQDIKYVDSMGNDITDALIESDKQLMPKAPESVRLNAEHMLETIDNYRNFNKSINFTKTLSIVIPIYNSNAFIKDTIDALYKVLGSHIDDTEVIVSDDNSEDMDYSFLQEYKNLKLYNNNIGGLIGINRNRGLRLAQGEYVYFLDHDDKVCPEMISDFFKMHDKGYDVLWYQEKHLYNGITHNIMGEKVDQKNSKWLNTWYDLHAKFFRLNFLRKNNIQFAPIKNFTDDVFIKKIKRYDPQIYECPKKGLLYNINPNSVSIKDYDNRCYFEEYFKNATTAVFWAYIDDGKLDKKGLSGQIKEEIEKAVVFLNKFYNESPNFKKSNIAIVATLLYLYDNWYSEKHELPSHLNPELRNILKRTYNSIDKKTGAKLISKLLPENIKY